MFRGSKVLIALGMLAGAAYIALAMLLFTDAALMPSG